MWNHRKEIWRFNLSNPSIPFGTPTTLIFFWGGLLSATFSVKKEKLELGNQNQILELFELKEYMVPIQDKF